MNGKRGVQRDNEVLGVGIMHTFILATMIMLDSIAYCHHNTGRRSIRTCRKMSGILRCEQTSMKCAPFTADSENSTPLLAMMPTDCP